MKKLAVPCLPSINTDEKSFDYVDKLFEGIPWESIREVNWPTDYPYLPKVYFRVAYTEDSFLIQFTVQEEQLKATYSHPNQNVWEDSCVEAFLSFDDGAHYYNLEFNLIGTGVVGYGTAVKSERKRLSTPEIEQINTFVQIKRVAGVKQWGIIEEIPLSLFKFDDLTDLTGRRILGNFYKCGDGLDEPHFVSWNEIKNPTPNFHLPQYFGEMLLD